MGQPKGGGYTQQPSLTQGQSGSLESLLQNIQPYLQGAAQGYQQFLPGGEGGKPIVEAAQQNFKQQTVPNILQSFGTGSKGGSGLNQALASGASNLNTNLGSQLAQMQLQASQGIGQLGSSSAQIGLGTTPFNYTQNQPPLWQQILLGLIGSSSEFGKKAAGAAFL